MKKIFSHIILSAAALCAVLSSCSLDRQPLNGPSSIGFPSTEEEAVAGTYAAYKGIAANLGIISVTWWRNIDCMTDIGTYRVTSGIKDLMTSSATASHTWPRAMYKKTYVAIARIHLVLDGLEDLRGTVSDETIDCLRAELLTMRAFCYDQLVQYFGAVPYIDHRLSLDDRDYARTDKETIISNILDDLSDETIDALPLRWNMESYGTARFSRVAAYMIKARIYLNYATDSNGYWEKAVEYAEKAISLAEQAGHKLADYDLTYYADADAGEPNCALFAYSGQTDDEWIWALQYNKLIDNARTVNIYYVAPRTVNGASWMGPSQTLIDANSILSDYQGDAAYTLASSSYGQSISAFLSPDGDATGSAGDGGSTPSGGGDEGGGGL